VPQNSCSAKLVQGRGFVTAQTSFLGFVFADKTLYLLISLIAFWS